MSRNMTTAFQSNAFQNNAFQVDVTVNWIKHGGDDAPKHGSVKRKKHKELRKQIEEAWAFVTGETAPQEVKQEALALVPTEIQKPVEWIAQDFQRTQKLLALWEYQIEQQAIADDDEEILMLLM